MDSFLDQQHLQPIKANFTRAARNRVAQITPLLFNIVLGSATVLSSTAVLSAEADSRAAIDVDGCSYIEQNGELTFNGCFELRQGSRLIKSSQATLVRDENNQFKQVELTGTPASWQETGDDGMPLDARARQINYDVDQQVITLFGDVTIRQGDREITSQQMRYDLRSGRVEGGDANDPDSRVRMRFPAVQPPTEPAPRVPPAADDAVKPGATEQ